MVKRKRKLVVRGALVAVVCLLLSLSFAFSRHFVPQGSRQKMITVDHQIRRVLWGAQRETLRDGATIQKSPVLTQPLLLLASVSMFFLPQCQTFLEPETNLVPENLVLELSPVLNL